MTSRAWRSGLALLLVCAVLVWWSDRVPAVVPAAAPADVFSAERAMAHVRSIAQKPHPSGSAEHARVRAYVTDAIRALGLEPQIQEATGVGSRNSVAAHVLNVLTRVPGRSPGGPAVLLAAHYDSQPATPGAGDDAAAVAAILETLRALRAGPPLEHDVIALVSDGEEAGLAGAAAFVREHPWARDVAAMLNFEGRGTTGPSLMFETGSGNLDTVRIWRRVPGATGTSLSVTVYRTLPRDTDLSELLQLKQPALNFAFVGGLLRYHTAKDDVEHLNVRSLQHHGNQALALTRAFGNGVLPRPSTEDAVFFALPGLGVVFYPERFAMPLAIAATAFVIAAGLLLRRRERHWIRDVVLGVAGTLISTAVAAGLAFGVVRLLVRLGAPTGRSPGFFAVAMAMIALSSAASCWALVRRWASPIGAQIGALLVWTAAAMFVTRAVPGASFLFVWPLLAATGAALFALVAARTFVLQVTRWAAALVVASIVVPTVYMIAVVVLGVSLPSAIMVALFMPLSLWLLVPLLESLTAAPRWITPLTAFAGAFVMLAAGMATGTPSAAHPEASVVAYAFDADTSRGWLVTLPEFARPGSWAADVLGPSARVVIPRTESSSDSPPEWLTRAIAGESRALAASAPSAPVGSPEVVVLADSPADGARHLELRVRPASGTYSIRIRVLNAAVLSSAVDGRVVDETRLRSPSPEWTLGYVDPPPDGFVVTLVVPNDKPLELELIARSLGLPHLSDRQIPARPEGVVPIQGGDQTAVRRLLRL